MGPVSRLGRGDERKQPTNQPPCSKRVDKVVPWASIVSTVGFLVLVVSLSIVNGVELHEEETSSSHRDKHCNGRLHHDPGIDGRYLEHPCYDREEDCREVGEGEVTEENRNGP